MVFGFIRIRVGSLRGVYGSLGSSGFAWVLSGEHWGHWVHSSSRRFTLGRLLVIALIRVSVGSRLRIF